jgi:hypothetical protein
MAGLTGIERDGAEPGAMITVAALRARVNPPALMSLVRTYRRS